MPSKKKGEIPPPDWSKVEFPSDRITLGQIRQEQSEMFDSDTLGEIHAMNFEAINTVRAELDLAEEVWKTTLGAAESIEPGDRLQRIVMLNDDYVRYGLSSGIAMTRQLVRQFERAAAEEARRVSGQGRKP